MNARMTWRLAQRSLQSIELPKLNFLAYRLQEMFRTKTEFIGRWFIHSRERIAMVMTLLNQMILQIQCNQKPSKFILIHLSQNLHLDHWNSHTAPITTLKWFQCYSMLQKKIVPCRVTQAPDAWLTSNPVSWINKISILKTHPLLAKCNMWQPKLNIFLVEMQGRENQLYK